MHCPTCHAEDTKVIDSRLLGDGHEIRRRRKCEKCEKRFTTYEKFQAQIPTIVKHDGRREAFKEQKIFNGLEKAVQKSPITTDQLYDAVEDLKKYLSDLGQKEVSSKVLGEWVTNWLFKMDAKAYVRFASFYWQYDDIEGFMSTLLEQKGKTLEGESSVSTQ